MDELFAATERVGREHAEPFTEAATELASRVDHIRACLAALAELSDAFPTPIPVRRERRALIAQLWADQHEVHEAIDTIERIEKLTVMRRRDYATAQIISDARMGWRAYAHALGDLVGSEDSALRMDAVVSRLPSGEIDVLGEAMSIARASLGRVRRGAVRILLLPAEERLELEAQLRPDVRLAEDALVVVGDVADRIEDRHDREARALLLSSDRGPIFDALRGLARRFHGVLLRAWRHREAATAAAIKLVSMRWTQECRVVKDFLDPATSGFPRLYLARAWQESQPKRRHPGGGAVLN